ncbi:hypothetical protein OROHE_000076 [Orobanche hederae]
MPPRRQPHVDNALEMEEMWNQIDTLYQAVEAMRVQQTEFIYAFASPPNHQGRGHGFAGDRGGRVGRVTASLIGHLPLMVRILRILHPWRTLLLRWTILFITIPPTPTGHEEPAMKNNTHTHIHETHGRRWSRKETTAEILSRCALPRWLSDSCVAAAVVRDRREIPMATSDLPRQRPAAAKEYSDSDQGSDQNGYPGSDIDFVRLGEFNVGEIRAMDFEFGLYGRVLNPVFLI